MQESSIIHVIRFEHDRVVRTEESKKTSARRNEQKHLLFAALIYSRANFSEAVRRPPDADE